MLTFILLQHYYCLQPCQPGLLCCTAHAWLEASAPPLESVGLMGLGLGKDHLCGKTEKVACSGGDKCHDKGWLKGIF